MGYLGTLFTIAPSHASPIWPAAGLAFAVALIYRKSVFPGLFIGILATQIYSFLDFSTPESSLPSLIIGVISSLGSCAQAFFAAFLINHYLGKQNDLIEEKEILLFFLFGALIACIIAPTIGITCIYFLDLITLKAIPISWVTWWVGDVIGIIIFTPIILSFIAKPKKQWQERKKLVSYPLLLVFLIVIAVFKYTQTLENGRIASVFQGQANVFHSALSKQLLQQQEVNEILKTFFDSSQFVSKEEFSLMSRPFLEKYSSIQALEWISYIPHKQRDHFENSGPNPLIIREPNQTKEMILASPRDEYFPITYVEPLQGNEPALGFDVASNPDALKAIIRARDNGITALTVPLQLVQDQEKKIGFVLYTPVYQHDNPLDSINQKKIALKGFIASVFRLEDKISAVYANLPNLQLLLRIESQEDKIFNNFPKPGSGNTNLLSLQYISQLDFANKIWTIKYQPSINFYHSQMSWVLWWILFGGFVITCLTSLGLLILTGRTLRTEKLVIERTLELSQSEEHFHTIFNEAPLGVAVIDSQTSTIHDVNPAFAKILGRSIEQLKSLNYSQFIHPDDIRENQDKMTKMNNGEITGYKMHIRYLQPDNTARWINMTIAPMLIEENREIRCLCMAEDITEIKEAEDRLKLSSKVFNDTNEGITITDKNGNIMNVNPAFSRITGYSLEEVIGKNPRILSSGKQNPDFYAQMWQTINEQGHWQGEVWNRSKEGSLYAELLSISPITSESGQVTHYVGIFTDITHIKKQQETLEKIAHYDALTQLPNRILLIDRFTQAIAHTKREKNQLAVCFLDLDNFKPINDLYGHKTGDQLLIEVAKRIKALIRNEDTVSRQGGDEFVLLLRDIQSFPHCEEMLTRIIKSLSKPYLIDGQPLSVSASIGVSLYPSDNSDLDTLMRHADQAMYHAKTSGRNRYYLFNTEQEQIKTQKSHQLKEIEQALIKGELCLYYQPKVNMASGEIFGAEALIRWNHPEKGLIPPIQFLPVIEQNQLEIEIGNWVIKQALNQLNEWQKQGIRLEVSVNISSYHLQHPSFISDLEASLALYPGVFSKNLQLEILESSALSDLHAITGIIKTCIHALGVNIALDDFGTGYSSLTHLRNLPVQTIKIDQTFVRDMLDDPSDYTIIDGVIGLADSFGRAVIAEGVETTEHGQMLIIMGCLNAQGYGIAKPMPADEISNWVKTYKPNQQWIECASRIRSKQQDAIDLFKLTSIQWQKLLQKNIQSPAESIEQWPILKSNKCHCAIWIQRIRKESLFSKSWLNQLDEAHHALHIIASELFDLYQEGNIETARNEFKSFQAAAKKMFEVLEQCE